MVGFRTNVEDRCGLDDDGVGMGGLLFRQGYGHRR